MTPASAPPARHAAHAVRILREHHRRALDPEERFAEVLFGLVMVLTFTCTLSVAEGGREPARRMFLAALACNVAWGVVDGVMFVLTSMAARARRAAVFRGIRDGDDALARGIVLGALPDGVATVTDPAEADRMVARVRALPEAPLQALVTIDDVRGAAWSAVLVILATFPPTVPFLLVDDPRLAVRLSNGVALASLFLAGTWLGRATGMPPARLGAAMAVLGFGLVALTIALGG